MSLNFRSDFIQYHNISLTKVQTGIYTIPLKQLTMTLQVLSLTVNKSDLITSTVWYN